MITIRLNELQFHSYHGVHEEEEILGNNYEVNVELSFDSTEIITELQQTINYVTVYEIIKQRMAVPTALLETLAQDLAEQIHDADKRIRSITVSVKKKNPPVPGMEGTVGVSYKMDF